MKAPRERRSTTYKREALPMAKKRMYRTTPVKRVHVQLLCEDVEGQHVVLGVDVAKKGMVAAVVDGSRAVRRTISWSHPEETDRVLDVLACVREHAASVSVAMEPSGTYGDALRWQCLERGFAVYRVNAKHTHDSRRCTTGCRRSTTRRTPPSWGSCTWTAGARSGGFGLVWSVSSRPR